MNNGSVKSYFSPYKKNEADLCKGYDGSDGVFYFNYQGALVPIKKYVFSDGQGNGIFSSDQLAKKDDLPNIFTNRLGTSNEEGNHVTTIKNLWSSFPERQVFACNIVDANNFGAFGFVYGNHKYGAVLYLAHNSCGIVRCNAGNFSDITL